MPTPAKHKAEGGIYNKMAEDVGFEPAERKTAQFIPESKWNAKGIALRR